MSRVSVISSIGGLLSAARSMLAGKGLLEQVMERVSVSCSGCWEWRGKKNWKGYGKWKSRNAHRVVFEMLRGPVPCELYLDHLCRNRACVNPDHLEPVSDDENRIRGRVARGLPPGPLRTSLPCRASYELLQAFMGGRVPLDHPDRVACRLLLASRSATHCRKGHDYQAFQYRAGQVKGLPARICRECERLNLQRKRRRSAAARCRSACHEPEWFALNSSICVKCYGPAKAKAVYERVRAHRHAPQM